MSFDALKIGDNSSVLFSMHIDEFKTRQAGMMTSAIFALYGGCRRRFLGAAYLLELRNPMVERLAAAGSHKPINLEALVSPFHVLEQRYVDSFFSSQTSLVEADEEDVKWSKYLHHVLIPVLVQNDGVVRNILRTVGVLECDSSSAAAVALAHEFQEMTMPNTPPAWAPEEGHQFL